MRGHIARRGERYHVVVDIGRREDSRRKQKWYSGFDDRKAAEVFLAKTLRELDLGSYVEPSNTRLRDYLLEEWLPASAARVRPSTLLAYAGGSFLGAANILPWTATRRRGVNQTR